MVLLVLLSLSVASAITFPCPSNTYRDLEPPNADPSFPTLFYDGAVPAGNPIQGHWSEVAKLALYRPPALTTVTRSNCPHLAGDLFNWHDPATWGGVIPTSGSVVLPANRKVLLSSCSVNPSTVFDLITIPATSELVFADAEIALRTKGIQVNGKLTAGSPTCRLRSKATITLHGSRTAQTLPADAAVKGISVDGQIDLHAVQYFPTWTRLALTASPGTTWIFVQDSVNWQAGQSVLISTTELKDARDWHRNEQRVIVATRKTTLGSAVTAIQLDSPLSFTHYGGREYQAEVSLLSRNFKVQGDEVSSEPTDTANAICKDPDTTSTYPCPDKHLTGFGGHIIIKGQGQGRFSGVELYRMGQTNVLGRYPLHWHMLGDQTEGRAYAQDCSVHRSFFRCFAIHGTHGVRLKSNTAYDAIGHCFFLEDGVEENNTFEYNFAALVHPLGEIQNPSLFLKGDSWWAQYLSTYEENANLILPSDMSAAGFYITNTYNNFVGNAASGGWTGFAMPSLKAPVKLNQDKNMTVCPKNRPFKSTFRGNSAHSSGYWWRSASVFYVGGELWHDATTNKLQYTAGRSATHDTCANSLTGTPSGEYGCWDLEDKLWLRFEDNKAFLSNRGLQHWGERSEIIRMEMHDVGLAMNVFGEVWIDKLLMDCRSSAQGNPTGSGHRPSWFNGCPGAAGVTDQYNPPWGICNWRDFYFWKDYHGFDWYDVGQRHIMTNSTFRNCRQDWNQCVYRPVWNQPTCDYEGVFGSLTHSDEFVPELMQATENIRFENTNGPRRFFSTDKADRVTVSGRLQSWADMDGSVVGAATPGLHMIGSSWAGEWWKYNQDCYVQDEAWLCRLAPGDSAASMFIWGGATEQQEAGIGSTYCPNGGGGPSCPVVAVVTHWGRTESQGLDVGLNPKITGPLISCSGGWFIRFVDSSKQAVTTPASLKIQSAQLARGMQDVLLLAIPYPAGTTFNIYNQAAEWCGTEWAQCIHPWTLASSLNEVRTGFGDRYYFDSAKQFLYIRVTQEASYWPLGQGPFTNLYTPYAFTRAGISLYESTFQSFIRIKAKCPSQNCLASSVSVPPALGTCNPTGSTNSPSVSPSQSTSPSRSPTTSPSTSPSRSPPTSPSTSPSRSRTTNTATPTPSRSLTSASPTATRTATASTSPTRTRSVTSASPTATRTTTASTSPTRSRSVTSASPTATRTATATTSPTGTISVTRTTTSTASPTPSRSVTSASRTTTPTPSKAPKTGVLIYIDPDDYPTETSWSLTQLSASPALLASGGPLPNTAEQFKILYLSPGQYDFRVDDSANDGMCCGYGQGMYRLFVGPTEVANGGQFLSSETKTLQVTPTTFACGGREIWLVMRTDGYPGETSWSMTDQTTNQQVMAVASNTIYQNADSVYVSQICAQPGRSYKLAMWDSWGDGLLPGGYQVVDVEKSTVLVAGGNFKSEQVSVFLVQ